MALHISALQDPPGSPKICTHLHPMHRTLPRAETPSCKGGWQMPSLAYRSGSSADLRGSTSEGREEKTLRENLRSLKQ